MENLKVHFNRVNMQRGKSEVWTAHSSKRCNQTSKISFVKDGEVICETIFNPSARQPRAFFKLKATPIYEPNGDLILEL